jgi:hypothetical protein
MAVAKEAVVQRAHYISEMSQNSDTYSTVQYCSTARDEESGTAVRQDVISQRSRFIYAPILHLDGNSVTLITFPKCSAPLSSCILTIVRHAEAIFEVHVALDNCETRRRKACLGKEQRQAMVYFLNIYMNCCLFPKLV